MGNQLGLPSFTPVYYNFTPNVEKMNLTIPNTGLSGVVPVVSSSRAQHHWLWPQLTIM